MILNPTNNSYHPHNQIIADSMPNTRFNWFTNEEVYKILTNVASTDLCNHHQIQPRNGTYILYDREIIKNFKKDLYTWKRRTNCGNSIREDRMQLKINGSELISACYTHAELMPAFHRRIYWLIHKPQHVLVHYLLKLSDQDERLCLNPIQKLTIDEYLNELEAITWPLSQHSISNRQCLQVCSYKLYHYVRPLQINLDFSQNTLTLLEEDGGQTAIGNGYPITPTPTPTTNDVLFFIASSPSVVQHSPPQPQPPLTQSLHHHHHTTSGFYMDSQSSTSSIQTTATSQPFYVSSPQTTQLYYMDASSSPTQPTVIRSATAMATTSRSSSEEDTNSPSTSSSFLLVTPSPVTSTTTTTTTSNDLNFHLLEYLIYIYKYLNLNLLNEYDYTVGDYERRLGNLIQYLIKNFNYLHQQHLTQATIKYQTVQEQQQSSTGHVFAYFMGKNLLNLCITAFMGDLFAKLIELYRLALNESGNKEANDGDSAFCLFVLNELDPIKCDFNGNTPLAMACINNMKDAVVELCHLCPASTEIKNFANLKPIDIVRSAGYSELVEVLTEAEVSKHQTATTTTSQDSDKQTQEEFALIDDFLWLNDTTTANNDDGDDDEGILSQKTVEQQQLESEVDEATTTTTSYIDEQDKKIKALADNIIAAMPMRIKSNSYDYRSNSITSDYDTLTTTSTSPTTTFHIDSPPSTEEFCKYFHIQIQNDFKQLTLNNYEQRELYEAALVIQNAYRRYLKRKKTRLPVQCENEQDEDERLIDLTSSLSSQMGDVGSVVGDGVSTSVPIDPGLNTNLPASSDEKQYEAACIIQKYFRRYKQYENVRRYTEAAVKIQTRYRAYKEQKSMRGGGGGDDDGHTGTLVLNENDATNSSSSNNTGSLVNIANGAGGGTHHYHHHHYHHFHHYYHNGNGNKAGTGEKRTIIDSKRVYRSYYQRKISKLKESALKTSIKSTCSIDSDQLSAINPETSITMMASSSLESHENSDENIEK